MGIHPCREADIAVTDSTGHDADVNASLKEQGRVGVPDVVKPDHPLA